MKPVLLPLVVEPATLNPRVASVAPQLSQDEVVGEGHLKVVSSTSLVVPDAVDNSLVKLSMGQTVPTTLPVMVSDNIADQPIARQKDISQTHVANDLSTTQTLLKDKPSTETATNRLSIADEKELMPPDNHLPIQISHDVAFIGDDLSLKKTVAEGSGEADMDCQRTEDVSAAKLCTKSRSRLMSTGQLLGRISSLCREVKNEGRSSARELKNEGTSSAEPVLKLAVTVGEHTTTTDTISASDSIAGEYDTFNTMTNLHQ